MTLLVGAYSNPAEEILILKVQAKNTDAQKKAAKKAVQSYRGQIQNNQTPQNLAKLQRLTQRADDATRDVTNLNKKIAEAELAYCNSSDQDAIPNASLENREVTQLDLDRPLGTFLDYFYSDLL